MKGQALATCITCRSPIQVCQIYANADADHSYCDPVVHFVKTTCRLVTKIDIPSLSCQKDSQVGKPSRSALQRKQIAGGKRFKAIQLFNVALLSVIYSSFIHIEAYPKN